MRELFAGVCVCMRVHAHVCVCVCVHRMKPSVRGCVKDRAKVSYALNPDACNLVRTTKIWLNETCHCDNLGSYYNSFPLFFSSLCFSSYSLGSFIFNI